jgi:hypothetical protein
MTLPTRAWNPVPITGTAGSFLDWNEDPVDAEGMVKDLTAELSNGFPATVAFDSFVIYNYPSEDEAPVPVASGALTDVGSEAAPGQTKAVQAQLTFFDTAFNTYKLVVLDVASFDDWEKQSSTSLHAYQEEVFTQITAETNAWASRAGFRPATLRSGTTKLNDELRKQYGMA